ncbi:MAG: PilW family protein [Planctomycetota bacterium]|jgi:prepilin-type N-terminal cleavage/methylation domain-containing protein
MKKAFTLIELVVTVALMGMVIFFTSIIFRTSVDAHRTSTANAEIMQKLRAITDQLNADFKGFRWSPWLKINFGFGESQIDGQTVDVRSDRVLFFANGDFQSTGQHGLQGKTKDETVVGNVAAVFYSLADIPSYSTEENRNPRKKILLRRQTILTAEADWDNLDLQQAGEYSDEEGLSSLSELAAEQIASVVNWWDTADFNGLVSERQLDPEVEEDLVKYMAKGVDDFSVQYVGVDYDEFGNVEDLFEFNEWRPTNKVLNRNNKDEWSDEPFLPSALKFTFKLYDSKGVIKNGRTFTHIVHLGN